ncbi:ubiquitin-associated protein 1-like [Pelodiscus sinensis]|uniref:ubiquitin-associated protein 1-like n=1 Tax=Pelodiscus sinensis TaxID=13735 RepID=UPI003F6BD098
MSYLDDIPFKMCKSFEEDPAESTSLISLSDFDIPDCTEILMCTMYDFSLERRVLYWIEAASGQETLWYEVTADVVPTAPPCWLLLVDPKENYVTSTLTEETTGRKAKDGVTHTTSVRRCVSLSAADVRSGPPQPRAAPAETESEDWYSEENEYSEGDEYSSTACEESDDNEEENILDNKCVKNAMPQHSGMYQFRPRSSPVLLDPPSEKCCHEPVTSGLIKQRRSMILFNSMKNELEEAKKKLAALVHPLNRASVEKKQAPRPFSLYQRSRSSRNLRYGPASDVSLMGTLTPTPPPTPCCSPRTLSAARSIPPIRNHKPTVASLSPYSCLPPPAGTLRPPSSHRAHPDSTADLLSALSQEERDLIEPVIALGYPIRRAILALQKTGRQSLGQFLSYLSACDRLLKQGYEEGQVEEAMEMFQYSEKKAAEFLHLLVQFKDMGFQQAEIKEVLLIYENHRDKALEELMTRTQ